MNHRNAWDLIPWFVNGSASDDECAQLQEHLDQCAQCRAELDMQRALMQEMRTRPLVEKMPHASYQKLRARIDAVPAVPQLTASQRPRRSRMVQWLTAAVVLHIVLLSTLVVVFLQGRSTAVPGAFRTVSSPAALATPGIRAVFSADLALGELHLLLNHAHLQISAGPSAEGVYTLAPDATGADRQQALLTLRAHPAVRFAEPVGP
jgi:anti-sigma factor RsiW